MTGKAGLFFIIIGMLFSSILMQGDNAKQRIKEQKEIQNAPTLTEKFNRLGEFFVRDLKKEVEYIFDEKKWGEYGLKEKKLYLFISFSKVEKKRDIVLQDILNPQNSALNSIRIDTYDLLANAIKSAINKDKKLKKYIVTLSVEPEVLKAAIAETGDPMYKSTKKLKFSQMDSMNANYHFYFKALKMEKKIILSGRADIIEINHEIASTYNYEVNAAELFDEKLISPIDENNSRTPSNSTVPINSNPTQIIPNETPKPNPPIIDAPFQAFIDDVYQIEKNSVFPPSLKKEAWKEIQKRFKSSGEYHHIANEVSDRINHWEGEQISEGKGFNFDGCTVEGANIEEILAKKILGLYYVGWEKVKSIQIEAEDQSPPFGRKNNSRYQISLVWNCPDKLTLELRNGNTKYRKIINGNTGFIDFENKRNKMQPKDVRQMLLNEPIYILSLQNMYRFNYKEWLRDNEKILDVVKITDNENNWINYYINRNTGLIDIKEIEGDYNGKYGLWKEIYSNYRIIQGYPFATKIEMLFNGEKVAERNISNIKLEKN